MSTFKKEFLSGAFYIGIAKYAGIISQLVISSILARLLTPADYGVIAIATVFIVFFNILSDLGIGIGVIQRKDFSEDDLDHLFSLNIYIGLTLGTLFFFTSGLISSLYDNNQLKPVCQLLSLLIIFTCGRTVPMNLLYREKQFKYIAFTNLFVQITCGIAAICLALTGWGVYALVFSQVGSAFLLLTIYIRKYHRRFHFIVNLEPLRKIFSYSAYNLVGSIFVYFTQNIDKLLIGKFVGAEPLGYYEKSYRLLFMPITNITFVITPVLHPMFSQFQNDYKIMAEMYFKLINSLAYISFPLIALFFFISSELVLIFFGDQWINAIPVFKIACFSIGFLMLNTTAGSIFDAAYMTKRGFYTDFVQSSIMISFIVLAIFLYNTIEAVAVAFLLARIIGTFVNFYSLMKGLKLQFVLFLNVIMRPIFVGALVFLIMSICVWFVKIDNIILSLILKSAIWSIVSLLVIQCLSEYNVLQMVISKVQTTRKKLKKIEV